MLPLGYIMSSARIVSALVSVKSSSEQKAIHYELRYVHR